MHVFEIHLVKGAEPKGGMLIVAFPSVGMVGTIAGNYITEELGMERTAYVVSDDIPPATLVQDGVPGYPLRIVSKDRLSILSSEFQMPLNLAGQMARTVLEWTGEKGFDTVLCLEGLMSDKSPEQEREIRVFGVGSTIRSREMLEKAGIEQFKTGVITGVSGALLSEGERTGRDVVCLLADASPMYPDARGAAKLVEAVSEMLPSVDIDVKELMDEAGRIEENVRSTVEKTKEMLASRQGQAERLGKSYMYG